MNTTRGFIFVEILVGIFIASIMTFALFEVSSRWLAGITRIHQTHMELKDAFNNAESINATGVVKNKLFTPKYTKAIVRSNADLPDFVSVKITSAKSAKVILQTGILSEKKAPGDEE